MKPLRLAFGLAAIIIIATMAMLNIVPAKAGTEDGSFCPTCPDWNNLDQWFAQKNAQSELLLPNKSRLPDSETQKVGSGKESYPFGELLTPVSAPLAGRVILDARSSQEYIQGHLPGGRNLYWKDLWPEGSFDPLKAEEGLKMLGVNRSDDVLVYGNGDDALALFWALDYLGHRNHSVLDGGVAAWRSKGLPLSRNAPLINRSNYTSEIDPRLLINSSTISYALGLGQVVDSRESFSDFGILHLKNAIQIPAGSLYTESHNLKGPSELEDLFSGRGLDKEKMQVVYATPGAYSLYWGLRLMGYHPSLVDGDWWTGSELAVSNIH